MHHVDRLNFTSSLRIPIATRFSEKTMKLRFRDHCLRTESAVPTRQESHVKVIAHIFHGFTEYRVVH